MSNKRKVTRAYGKGLVVAEFECLQSHLDDMQKFSSSILESSEIEDYGTLVRLDQTLDLVVRMVDDLREEVVGWMDE